MKGFLYFWDMDEMIQPTGNNASEYADNKKKFGRRQPTSTSLPDIGKIPPQAIDLEEAVLGALMLEKDALTEVIDVLRPEAFYKEAHQRIFKAITSLFRKSEPVDILTVTNELKTSGELELVGGPWVITKLTNRVASAANVEYHARIIVEKYIQRELIRISTEIIKDAYEDTSDAFDLLDKAERGLFSVSETNLRRSYLDMPTLVQEAVKMVQLSSKKDGSFTGVPSGFTELDRVTSGWQPSDLIIVAARPGMGKTAFTLTTARNACVDYGKAVAFFSLEMSAVQLVTRLISGESEIPAEKLRRGNLESYEWQQLYSKMKSLEDAKIYIDDTPSLSVFELRAKCRRLKQQFNIDMVMIDYLQLMSSGTDMKGNRVEEISMISRSLKSLAKELSIPVIALSQLSRAVEQRGGNKKPVLSDLRESGAIEQDADMVIFIYRPEYYKLDEDESGNSTAGMAEISIAKHRNGSLADVPLRFIGKYAKFADPEDTTFSGIEGAPDMSIPANQNFDISQGMGGFGNQSIPNTITMPSKMNDDAYDTPF